MPVDAPIEAPEDVFIAGSLAAGAVFPGEAPGAVMTGAFGAPVGAGDGALLDMLPGDIAGCAAVVPVLVEPALPGDMPGAVIAGALGAPVGAGEVGDVCAKATPVDRMIAAEASQSLRIAVSFFE